MTSIIPNKNKKEKQRKTKLWPIVFWLMIWQAASVFVGQEILLASPVSVIMKYQGQKAESRSCLHDKIFEFMTRLTPKT